ncbi:MAG: amino acid permease [Spirochaetes bacterium]|nr:amino acid permease [Spirochaetota bacterium]
MHIIHNKNFTEETNLTRGLGLPSAVSIVISRIIGSGIFRTPGPIMALVGSTMLFGSVWIIGAVITIFAAVCYAELVAMMPRSGGPYIYLKEAYGPLIAFLRGWAMFFVSETGAIAAVALVFAEYTQASLEISSGIYLSHAMVVIIALLVIVFHTFINCFGVRLSGVVQIIISSSKIIALGYIITACFTKNGNVSNFYTPLLPEHFTLTHVLGIGAALRYAFFAFSGWEGATYVAEEVKNPRKNLPMSLLIGIACVLILYLSANAAYLFQVPVDKFAISKWIAVDALQSALGATGALLVAYAVMVNTFGNVGTQVMVKARTWHAMAQDNLFFSWCAKVHNTYKTPNNAMIMQGVWACVLVLFASIYKNSYEAVIDYFSATGTIFNILTLTSVIVLRRKYPEAVRPFKTWGYPVTVILVVLFYVIYLIVTLITAFIPSLLGIILTSTGLIYYWIKIK